MLSLRSQSDTAHWAKSKDVNAWRLRLQSRLHEKAFQGPALVEGKLMRRCKLFGVKQNVKVAETIWSSCFSFPFQINDQKPSRPTKACFAQPISTAKEVKWFR